MPNSLVQVAIPRDDLFVVDMLLITKDELPIHGDIADRRTSQREYDDRKQVFGRVSGDGKVIQIDGEEIGACPGL